MEYFGIEMVLGGGTLLEAEKEKSSGYPIFSRPKWVMAKVKRERERNNLISLLLMGKEPGVKAKEGCKV